MAAIDQQSDTTTVSLGLRTLLAHCIDYAGIFPPAKLPLDQALQNYARYSQQSAAWLLGRFVCPIGKLKELDAHRSLLQDLKPHLQLALVGTAGVSAGDFTAKFEHDIQTIIEFLEVHGDHAEVESLELKLPVDANEPEMLTQILDIVASRRSTSKLWASAVFLEVPSGVDWQPLLPRLLQAIDAGEHDRFGLKIRVGGLPKDDLPSKSDVAFFIDACRAAGVTWKATAGLHHPLPTSSSSDSSFGFLNLSAAAVLAAVHGLNQSQITTILTETSMSEFGFNQEAFSWGKYRVAITEIEQARRRSIESLGSCSFDEPCDGLRDLKLIT